VLTQQPGHKDSISETRLMRITQHNSPCRIAEIALRGFPPHQPVAMVFIAVSTWVSICRT